MTPVEIILRKFVKEKRLRLAESPEDRLKGSFVWIRASRLFLTGDALEQRVRSEYDLVVAYLNQRLGPNRKEGFLVPVRGGAADPVASPHHLDLLDLARRRDNDPTNLDSPDTSLGRHLRQNARTATTARVRAVLAIVWRAAALESELWSPEGETAALAVAALDEVLSRRLRVVERMAHNIGSREEMLGVNELDSIPRAAWGFGAESNRNWFDGLRVRLFEYPFTHPQAPIPPAEMGTTWLPETRNINGAITAWRLAYNVIKSTTRVFTDNSTEPFPASMAWRFAIQDDFFWQVGQGGRYRIDLLPDKAPSPVSPKTGAEVIDAVFEYQSMLGGRSIRADFWGRAWMYCDHVCAALLVEALLFGRRRRKGLTAADAEFNALVARRPQVLVDRLTEGTGEVRTGFVSLAAHLGVDVAADRGVMMSSQTTNQIDDSFDPHFRNVRLTPGGLQVGDQVIIRNSVIMNYISSGGEWGLENAIVMDVDPSVDNRNDRAGIHGSRLMLQGHGTLNLGYDKYRDFLADVLEPNFNKLIQLLVQRRRAQPGTRLLVIEDRFPSRVVPAQHRTVVQWSPYDDLNTIVLDPPVLLPDGTPISELASGPWWIIIGFRPDFESPQQALASIPKSIGDGVANATGVNPMISTPNFTPGADFWNNHVVFPLFEPVILPNNADGLARAKRHPWSAYFNRKKQNQPIKRTFLRPLPLDGSVIPGLFRRGASDQISAIQVKIDPQSA